VAINNGATATATLARIRPTMFVKGIDYAQASDSAGFAAERAAAMSLGIEVCFTRTAKESATALLDRMGARPPVMPFEGSRQ
jgi:hypothetical protein